MKILLTLILCSSMQGICMDPYPWPEKFNDTYDCMQFGYEESKKKMAEIGNPNSITDACVAGLCARTSIRGAFLNVQINCIDYNDKSFVDKITIKGVKILDSALKLEEDITAITEKIMQS